MDKLAIFVGVTTPVSDLARAIQEQGWQLGQVKFDTKLNAYTAEAISPHGETLEKTGPDDATAVSNALLAVTRRNHMRTTAQYKVGMWRTNWHERQREIAEAYRDAPIYDPKAVAAYKALGDDSMHRLHVLGSQLHIEPTNDPQPYKSAEDMRKDVHDKRHYYLTQAGASHPVWTSQQVAAFRAVHDILGHGVAGGEYDWPGRILAAHAHAPLLTKEAQQALFSEAVARPAFLHTYGAGPQKVALFPDFTEHQQGANNPSAHTGIHPSQSTAPVAPTEGFGLERTSNWRKVSQYDRWTQEGQVHPYRDLPPEAQSAIAHYMAFDGEAWKPPQGYDWKQPKSMDELLPHFVNQYGHENFGYHPGIPLRDLQDEILKNDDIRGLGRTWEDYHKWYVDKGYMPDHDVTKPLWPVILDNEHDEPLQDGWHRLHDYARKRVEKVPAVWYPRQAKVASWGNTIDVNKGWDSGVDPLPVNGYIHHGDPLQAKETMDNASLINTGWSKFAKGDGSDDRERMKQAIVNAFRVVLLSPRKDLRWNAIHYQDIANVPGGVDDPKVYWDMLEGSRRKWNEAQGIDPEAHMVFYKFLKPFEARIAANHPEKGWEWAKQEAKQTLFNWWTEEQERIQAEDADKPAEKQRHADEVERRANEALARRMQLFLKPKDDKTDVEDGQLSMLATTAGLTSGTYTGDPQIDRLIDEFKFENFQQPRAPGDWVNPEDRMVAEQGDPSRSYNTCNIISSEFNRFMERHGYKTALGWSSEKPNGGGFADKPWKGDWQQVNTQWFKADDIYPDRSQDPGPNHCVNRLETRAGTFLVDWSASQYGYEEVPKVQRLTTAAGGQYNLLTGQEGLKYGAFMGTHLKAIAQVSQHADEILDAALQDVREHDGEGHHFRHSVLQLGVSGVGPKVCSFAWLLLQPLTSQLATIDTHMMDVLGHDYEKDMNNRDYFKFEREFRAGLDAAGYAHLPLGSGQWGMWDYKRTGPGSHQDHSAMRVLDPKPHPEVNWVDKAVNLKGESWAKQAPDWWQYTQPARDAVAEDWDKTYGTTFAQNKIPYQDLGHTAAVKRSYDEDFPYYWDRSMPVGSSLESKARTLAEHAKAARLSEDSYEDWLDDHKKDTRLDDEAFKRFKKKSLRKFDRLSHVTSAAIEGPTPYFTHPETQVAHYGMPGQSMMEHARLQTGLTTQDVWRLLEDEHVHKA